MNSQLTNASTGQAFKAGSNVKAWMNKKERALIEDIYRDCLKLKKRNELTEFGRGQLALCRMLLEMEK